MPPFGYLTSEAIEEAVAWLNESFPSFTDRFALAEESVEGRTIHGLRIRSGTDRRNGVLLIGGTHARELINPDLLVGLAYRICFAYADGTGLTFQDIGEIFDPFPENKRYSAVEVKMLVDGLDIFIVPNVNPDGRQYILDDYPDRWDYRTNRRPGGGVDLNRNFDIVWDEMIGASDVPGDETYHGPEPFSEPESRSVRELLRTLTQIVGVADVHSYAQGILYPWGHADDQTTDPDMNFQNPDYDGERRSASYDEYIPRIDLEKFIDRGEKVRDAIATVRGRQYEVNQPEPVIGYYTSGSTRDYAYSRYFRGPNAKVWPYTIETNREGTIPCEPDDLVCRSENRRLGFSPPYFDALRVMTEVQAGLVQFLLSFLCVVRQVGSGPLGPDILDEIGEFRDVMLTRRRGRGWAELLDRHNEELLRLVTTDRAMRQEAEAILAEAAKVVVVGRRKRPPVIPQTLAERVDRLAERVAERASPRLREAIASVREDLRSVVGMTARDTLGEELGDADPQRSARSS